VVFGSLLWAIRTASVDVSIRASANQNPRPKATPIAVWQAILNMIDVVRTESFLLPYRPAPSTKETQRQDQNDGAHKARDKDPAFERCIEDDLAAAGLLGRIGLPRWRSRLCWAFSDHDHGLPMRLSGHGKGTSQVFGGSLMTVLQSNLSDDQ